MWICWTAVIRTAVYTNHSFTGAHLFEFSANFLMYVETP